MGDLHDQPTSSPAASLPEAAAVGALNHVLRQQSWATARLRRFAGKTVRVGGGPLGVRFTIQENGEVTVAAPETAVDAGLEISAGGLLAWLSSRELNPNIARLEGDSAVAMEVGKVLGQLRWDAEEDLSRIFGDVAAHRLATTAASLLAWQKEAAWNLARNFSEYWTEEQPLLAKPRAVRRFLQEVDEARDGAERLEKRIERLEQKQSAVDERR